MRAMRKSEAHLLEGKRFGIVFAFKPDGKKYYQIYDAVHKKFSRNHYLTFRGATLKRRERELEIEWEKFYKENGGCEEDWKGKAKEKGKLILNLLDKIAEDQIFFN